MNSKDCIRCKHYKNYYKSVNVIVKKDIVLSISLERIKTIDNYKNGG